MPVYHTRDGAVYLATTVGGTPRPVIKLTNWTLDMSAPRIDVTNFDSTNQEEVQGWPARRGTFAGFWDDTEDGLFLAAAAGGGVGMYLYPTRRAPGKYFYGTAWIDASIEADVNNAGRVRGNFSAAASWGRV